MDGVTAPAPEVGFNHLYPARKCPVLRSSFDWEQGESEAYQDHKEGLPPRNPFSHSSDAWRGYEYGVFVAEAE